MKTPRRDSAPLSRRRFVALLAAGSAALIAPGGAEAAAAAVAPAARPRVRSAAGAAATAALSPADRKELLRQKASTESTLAVIRNHAMPPGTEMAGIFRPLRPRRGNG